MAKKPETKLDRKGVIRGLTEAEQAVQNFLDKGPTYAVPNFGQDDPAGPIVHKPSPIAGQGPIDVGDRAVPDATVERGLKPWDASELLKQLEGAYPNPQQLRNNKPLVMPRSGPLINTPLPTHTGPLINMPLSGLPGGSMINTPLPGLGVGGSLINKPAPGLDLRTLKSQLQAKAHGYAHLIA